MQIAHPVGKKRVAFHFFLGNVTGAERTAAVAEHDVKVASMISVVRGENLPMIHSISRIGMESIRNPMTVIATMIRRIIIKSSFCLIEIKTKIKAIPKNGTLVQV